MTYSANEIAGLCQKAARGAGFPPAQAETFGRAAAVHLGTGGAPEALTDALRTPSDSPILRLPLLMDDILRGLTLAGPTITLTLQPGDEALAPAYARLLQIKLTDCQVSRIADGLPRLTVSGDPATRVRLTLPPRINAPTGLIDKLTRLAAATYVPATAASRAGAGAGNIDND